MNLGQQLPSSVTEPQAQVAGRGQGLAGRTEVVGVAVDAAKLVERLRPGQVIPQFGELLQ